jgi:hypothetical protein
MNHHVWLARREQRKYSLLVRQVVLFAARDKDILCATAFQFANDVRTEKTSATSNKNPFRR